MCLIIHKIWICLDGSRYFIKLITVFQFDINHTAVNTCSGRNSHGKSSLYTINSFYSYCMSHTHSRTKVCISNSFRSNRFQQSTYDRVASRIPTCRNNRNCIMLFCRSRQCATQIYNTGMNIEAVNRIDAKCKDFFGISLYTAGWCTKNCNINAFQFLDILYNRVFTQFCGTIFSSSSAYYTGNFKVGSRLQRFEHVLPDIAIANNGCSYFFHSFIEFVYQFSILSAQK